MPIKQDHRFIAISTALGPDVLALRSFSLQEQISRPFQIEAELSSENGEVDLDKVVGFEVTLRLQIGANTPRYFNGFVSRLVQVANSGGHAHYRATIVPWLWFLTRTSDCRVWAAADEPSAGKTVPEIIEAVFQAHGFHDYKLSLTGAYPKREFCVQYRETDFNFVSRLMEQEGIYYYFEHENGKHTLVLADSISAHSPYPGYAEVIFHELEKGATQREAITDWILQKEVQPVATALNDFDFKKPKTSLRSASNVSRTHGAALFEIYDYPGEYLEAGEGDSLAQIRLEELQTQYEVLHGQTTVRGMAAGCTFKLKQHPRAEQNREYLITGVSLHADAGEFASSGATAGGGGEFFSCSITTIAKEQQFRPLRLTPKPVVQGLQTAIVTGPKGEEIHTDKYGRVKVQFHWDRYGKADQDSSCWIRVSSQWAGKKWGAIYLPRIGQEVIVEYLEGDPDRPLITGRVYNGDAMPPYDLPAEKTKSTVKSNSSKGGNGFNEIRFEDKKGSEQIFVHGEKNLDERIKNNTREWIGNERHLIVKKDQLEKVEGDKHSIIKGENLIKIEGDQGVTIQGNRLTDIEGKQHLTVVGDQNAKIGGDDSLKVAGNLNTEAGQKISIKAGQDFHGKAGMNYAMDAGMCIHIKGGMTVVIEGGMQLSLKAAGSFVDIGPAGVSISGPMVMINSGGAAASGSGSSPTAPTAPEPPDLPKEANPAADAKSGQSDAPPKPPKPPKPVTFSPAAVVLQNAAESGAPFCEKCEAAKAAAAGA